MTSSLSSASGRASGDSRFLALCCGMTFAPDGDVDVLYEFLPGREPGWAIESIEQELSELLGRRVDLVPLKYLNHRIRERILSEAEVQYAV